MIRIFRNTNEIANALAEMLFELMGNPGTEPIHIALSGGNTPKLIFKYLNENYGMRLADRRFHFWWGDERCVPPTSDESNYKWAYEYWLKPIEISEENIHRVKGENNPELEAIRYSDEMKKWIRTENGFPVIDLNLLGLGEDGHTASIFPRNIELLSSEKWCAVATHPTSGQKRITLTGKALNNSETVVFISTGAGKAQMVMNVAVDSKPEFPASHIIPVSGNLIWLVDKGAVSFLKSK
jgi:6-phosphogluconolactonase